MANPSLQIGNDNWAIKEDNLLGYSTAGTRFVPQPITMTRATASTRVNPSGLVEDVALLGSELVTNGDFATDSDWTKGTGATISNNLLNFDNVNNDETRQLNLFPTPSLGTYEVSFDISNYVGGHIDLYLGGYQRFDFNANSNGTWKQTCVISNPSSNNIFYFIGDNFTGSIDNVSVKEATIDNLPRVDYTDGTSSLLVEPQRTNLITYSEDFSSWNKLAAVVTTNQTTSPSGTLTADKITYDGTTYGRVEQTVAVTNGNTYSWSVYLKNNDLSDVTQVWLGFSQAGQGEFVTITNEWQRYETVQVANGSNEYPRVQFTGTGSLYAWGAQLEEGSYPTSYIPTSGSTVTRNQDIFTRDGIGSLINSTEGVLFVEMAALSESGNYRELGLSDGTTSNRVLISYKSTDNVIRGSFQGSGGTNLEYTVASSEDFHKIAVKWKVNDFALWVDGVERATDTSGSSFPADTLNSLNFNSGAGGDIFYGKVKQLQVYKTALTDTQLAALTS